MQGKKRCAIHHNRCSENLIDNIFKMVFTVTGEVRPKNRLFEINQTVILSFCPNLIKRCPMTDQSTHPLLILSTIYTKFSLHFSEDPDIKSIAVKKSVAISPRHCSTAFYQ